MAPSMFLPFFWRETAVTGLGVRHSGCCPWCPMLGEKLFLLRPYEGTMQFPMKGKKGQKEHGIKRGFSILWEFSC